MRNGTGCGPTLGQSRSITIALGKFNYLKKKKKKKYNYDIDYLARCIYVGRYIESMGFFFAAHEIVESIK
jgi:hypothetical protein